MNFPLLFLNKCLLKTKNVIKLKYKEYKNIFIKTNDCMLIKRNKKSIENNYGGKSMLIKTNKTKELVESKLGIDFEEFKLVGCREISALTLIYEKNNELYVIQIANNIISSISKILSINERDNFSKLFLKNKMVKYKSKFLMIYDFYLNEKDKIFIFNETNDKVYNVYESESPLTLDKTEMTMIKMLGNFIDEEEIKKFKCQ